MVAGEWLRRNSTIHETQSTDTRDEDVIAGLGAALFVALVERWYGAPNWAGAGFTMIAYLVVAFGSVKK